VDSSAQIDPTCEPKRYIAPPLKPKLDPLKPFKQDNPKPKLRNHLKGCQDKRGVSLLLAWYQSVSPPFRKTGNETANRFLVKTPF
jgi:hypothetical protein